MALATMISGLCVSLPIICLLPIHAAVEGKSIFDYDSTLHMLVFGVLVACAGTLLTFICVRIEKKSYR